MLAQGGTGTDTFNYEKLPAGYDPTKLLQAVPNYGAPNVAPVGAMPAGPPARQGFVDIDPTTGKPKMLPYTPGSGAGIFNQVMNDPNRLRNLMGGLTGRAPGVGPTPLGGGPSAAPPGPGGVSAPGTPNVGVGPEGNLPTDLLGQTAGNLSGALRGELPPDVLNLLQQQAAEYGVGGGTSGSQFAGYAGLRNLGLTSLDRMKHAEDLLAQQFMTPAQKADLAERKEERGSRERIEKDRLAREQARFDQELAQKKLEFAQKQAAYENELKFNQQQAELKALNGKYGGLPGYGGGGGGGDVLFGSQPYGSRGLRNYGVTTIT
jgi:hypothetical protein